MLRLHHICCLLFLAVCLSLPAGAAVPTCAVVPDPALGFDGSPLCALFEAQLANSPKVDALERAEIVKVLGEQKLSLLFSPEGGNERVVVGQMLKVDLLVLLQAAEVEDANQQKIRSVRLIVSETKGGLRLVMGTLPWSDNAEADLPALPALFEKGLAKYAGPITEICAVPAFVSQSLTHQYDSLGGGYAALITQKLLEQPGVVVVELSEAQAVSRELGLIGGGIIERKAPLFLTGDFRYTGQGAEERVAMHLVLKRGTTELKAVSVDGLPPVESGPWLLESTQALLASANIRLPVGDAAAQAAQLAAEAPVLRKAGQWEDALDLLQASLLVKPDQPPVLYEAAVLTARVAILVRGPQLPPRDPELFLRDARKVLDGYRRTRDILDAWQRLTHKTGLDPMYTDAQNNFQDLNFRLSQYLMWISKDYPNQRELLAEYRQVIREETDHLFLELGKDLSDPQGNEWFIFGALATRIEDSCRYLELPPREQYALRLRALRLTHANKFNEYMMANGLGSTFQKNVTKEEQASPEFAAFLVEMKGIGGPTMEALAEFFRTADRQFQRAVSLPNPWEQQPAAPPKTGPAAKVTFVQVPVVLHKADGSEEKPPAIFGPCIPCGADVDALFGNGQVFLMKEKGKLESIYQASRSYDIADAQFDGRLLWATVLPKGGRTGFGSLVVVDPATGKTTTFTEADGLPASSKLITAAWKPGCLLVAGYTGKGWCATVTLGDDGKKTVDVFHEARIYPDPTNFNVDRPLEPTTAFLPGYFVRVADPRAGYDVFLLGRLISLEQQNVNHVCPYPLVVDPVKRTVTTLPTRLDTFAPDAIRGDTVYYLTPDHRQFCAASFPTLALQDIAVPFDLKPVGGVLLEAKRVHFYHLRDRVWWVGETLDGPFTQIDLKAQFPTAWLSRLCPSNHYGLLLTAVGESTEFYQVQFGNADQ